MTIMDSLPLDLLNVILSKAKEDAKRQAIDMGVPFGIRAEDVRVVFCPDLHYIQSNRSSGLGKLANIKFEFKNPKNDMSVCCTLVVSILENGIAPCLTELRISYYKKSYDYWKPYIRTDFPVNTLCIEHYMNPSIEESIEYAKNAVEMLSCAMAIFCNNDNAFQEALGKKLINEMSMVTYGNLRSIFEPYRYLVLQQVKDFSKRFLKPCRIVNNLPSSSYNQIFENEFKKGHALTIEALNTLKNVSLVSL